MAHPSLHISHSSAYSGVSPLVWCSRGWVLNVTVPPANVLTQIIPAQYLLTWKPQRLPRPFLRARARNFYRQFPLRGQSEAKVVIYYTGYDRGALEEYSTYCTQVHTGINILSSSIERYFRAFRKEREIERGEETRANVIKRKEKK